MARISFTSTFCMTFVMALAPVASGQGIEWDGIVLTVGDTLIEPLRVRTLEEVQEAGEAPAPHPWVTEEDVWITTETFAGKGEADAAIDLVVVMRGGDGRDPGFGGDPGIPIVLGGPSAEARPSWELEISTHEPIASDGAFLMAARQPHASFGSIRLIVPITIKGVERALITGGERSDVLLVDVKSGSILQRLDAPWEIERGFIGPSVWQVQLERFGNSEFGFATDEDPAEVEQLRKDYETRSLGWILGGPYVAGDSIFLATSSASPGQWPRHRATCHLLELNHSLDPKTRMPAPEPLNPHLAKADEQGIT